MAGERRCRMAQDMSASERQILFGQGATEAATLAGRDHESVERRHFQTLAKSGHSRLPILSSADDVALQKEKV
jgi:hypothetical protein